MSLSYPCVGSVCVFCCVFFLVMVPCNEIQNGLFFHLQFLVNNETGFTRPPN